MNQSSLRRVGFLAVLFFLLSNSSVWAADSVYRHIDSLSIDTQEKAATAADIQVCKGFKLAKTQVLHILQNSTEIDPRTYANDLDTAPCTIEGRLKTKNGLTATWQIEMSGKARVVFDNDHVLLLHCKSCSKSPFAR
jgi:hypothetical protein